MQVIEKSELFRYVRMIDCYFWKELNHFFALPMLGHYLTI
jgi:hypothetical protein